MQRQSPRTTPAKSLRQLELAQAASPSDEKTPSSLPCCDQCTTQPLLLHQRQLHIALMPWGMPDFLLGFLVVAGFGPEDIRDEGLRVPVVEREPAGLHLHHDAMAWQEDMVRRGQQEFVFERRVGRNGMRDREALTVAAAEDVRRDHQLVAAEV